MIEPKQKTKRRKRCESCHQLKHDVEHVIDSYTLEIDGREVWVDICTECHNAGVADV